MAEIYRKKALDRLSSPEQLDRMIPITQPMTWLVLIGAAIITIAVLFWGVTGSITQTMSLHAVADREGQIVTFIPIGEVSELKPAQRVNYTIMSGRDAGKTMTGRVIQVEDSIADEQTIAGSIEGEALTSLFPEGVPTQKVVLTSDSLMPAPGTVLQADIVLRQVTPLQYAFSMN